MSIPDNVFKNVNFPGRGMGEIPGSLDGHWKAKQKVPKNVDPNAVFVINDIEVVIPPTQIVVKKENLHWSWKTLRSNISTKIASGNAMSYVGLTIVFTPDLILHLHRLIVEFKSSPFCYVENSFLRQSLCGDWPVFQNMAFTMTSFNVSNMPGFPGTFIVQMEMRLFNYFAYTPNFLFKDEWQTKPVRMSVASTDSEESFAVSTIPTINGPQLQSGPTIMKKTETGNIDSFSLVQKRTSEKGSKLTLQDLVATHAGVVFDMLPLPNQMQKCRPVPPYHSNIYVRYINDLQMKALFNNFGIDVYAEFENTGKTNFFIHLTIGESWQDMYSGANEDQKEELTKTFKKYNRYTKVYGLQTGNIPQVVRNTIIKKMLYQTSKFRIIYDEYKVYKESDIIKDIKWRIKKKSIKKLLSENARTIGTISESEAITVDQETIDQQHKRVDAQIADVSSINFDDAAERFKKRAQKSSYSMNSTNPAKGQKVPNDPAVDSDLLFFPPVRQGYVTSPYGMRDRGKINKVAKTKKKPRYSLHAGIDLVTLVKAESKVNSRGNKETRYDPNGKKDGNGRPWRIGGVTPIFAVADGVIAKSGISIRLAHSEKIPLQDSGKSSDKNITTSYIHLAYKKEWDVSYLAQLKQSFGERCLIMDSNGKAKVIAKGTEVKRGDIIGLMGNTGGSTGPHLHFEVRADGVPLDPWIFLNAKKDNASAVNPEPELPGPPAPENANSTSTADGSSEESSSNQNGSTEQRENSSVANDFQSFSTAETAQMDQAAGEHGGITSEELEEILDSYDKDPETNESKGRTAWRLFVNDMVKLNLLGYYMYKGDYRATNVYKRSRFLTFDDPEHNAMTNILRDSMPRQTIDYATSASTRSHSLNEFLEENSEDTLQRANDAANTILKRRGMIVTGLGASLQHVVASIPIIGLETPTHQHLGSVEPSYYLEMNVLSDEVTNLRADGLDAEGQIFLSLQNSLQSNAKFFRAVPDSFCVSIDSFITRLMGTYDIGDIVRNEETADVTAIKRHLFSNVSVNTVEGSPGRHAMFTQFATTNPYKQNEEINAYQAPKESYKITEEDIKMALNKVKDMNLTDHGKMALMIATFGKIMQKDDSEEFIEKKVIDSDKDKMTQLINPTKGNGETFLAGFEYETKEVFVKKGFTDDGFGEIPTDGARILQLAQEAAARFIEANGEKWGWGEKVVAGGAGLVALWVTRGKGAKFAQFMKSGGGGVGTSYIPRGIGISSKPGSLYKGVMNNKAITGTASLIGSGASRNIMAVGSAGTLISGGYDALLGADPDASIPEITEEQAEEIAQYIHFALKADGYSLEDRKVIVSNSPISSDLAKTMFGDEARIYQMPDGRTAVEPGSIDEIKNHFAGNEDSNPELNSLLRDSEESGGGETDDYYLKDVTDFINAYPQYTSLTFKGEKVNTFMFSGEETSNTGIAQIMRYNTAIAHIEITGGLMLAEPYFGGVPYEEVEEKTFGILKIKKDAYVDGDFDHFPTYMFGSFFHWAEQVLTKLHTSEINQNKTDGLYSYINRSLGWTSTQIGGFFNKIMFENYNNLHPYQGASHIDADEWEEEPGVYAHGYIPIHMCTQLIIPPYVKNKIDSNVWRSKESNWPLISNFFSNGGWSDIASSFSPNGAVSNVPEHELLFGVSTNAHIGNFISSFGGYGANSRIMALMKFYESRSQIAYSYLNLNLERGAYGLTQSIIDGYMPYLGGIINMFVMDKAAMFKSGFIRMFPQFNEILKFLLYPRSVGGVPAYRKYVPDNAGVTIQSNMVTRAIGLDGAHFDLPTFGGFDNAVVNWTNASTQLAFETAPRALGTSTGGGLSTAAIANPVGAVAVSGMGGFNYGDALTEMGITDFSGYSTQRRRDNTIYSEAGISESFRNRQQSMDISKWMSDPINSFFAADPISNQTADSKSEFFQFISIDNSSEEGVMYDVTKNYEYDESLKMMQGRDDARVQSGSKRAMFKLHKLVDMQDEHTKLTAVAEWLYAIGAQVLADPEIAFALGMESFHADKLVVSEYQGIECYPDLNLPSHPYYTDRNAYATGPDFYMWNVYDDGPAGLNKEIRDMLYANTETAVMSSYEFLKKMQGKGFVPKNDRSLSLATQSHLNQNSSNKINATFEGSDMTQDYDENGELVDVSPCTSAFYGGQFPSDGTKDHVEYMKKEGSRGIEAVKRKIEEKKAILNSEELRKEKILMYSGIAKEKALKADIKKLEDQVEYIEGMRKDGEDFRFVGKLSNWHGVPTAGHEGTDLLFNNYTEMYDKATSIEAMFGSRAGYTGNTLRKDMPETAEAFIDVVDSAAAAQDQFAHQFDPNSLKQLAKDSVVDIISEKYTMKRAYPTFKLFFIEEDELETRFINYDDFYSFNGVKEFTIHQSRKNPGDVATIVLQNVSGTLDGTKRTAIRDVDYFDKKMKGEIVDKYGSGVENLADNHEVSPAMDQPFGSIVLRPGLNVQLRCGYSNDPNMLEVMISGRITELSWGKSNDMCEITVQSFGTELTQYVKTDDRSFFTTHQLLGAMMLEPELQHFGRWEFGAIRQYGENKDSTLDFYDYAQDSDKWKWGFADGVADTLANHSGKLVLGTAAFIALGIFTRGKSIQSTAQFLKHGLKAAPAAARGANKYSQWAFRQGGRLKNFALLPFTALKNTLLPAVARSGTESAKLTTVVDDVLIQLGALRGGLARAVGTGAKSDYSLWMSSQAKILTVVGKGLSTSQPQIKSLMQAQAAIAKALKNGAPLTDDMILQYGNALKTVEKFARANSFYSGRLAAISAHGVTSGAGIYNISRVAFSTLFSAFNRVWMASFMIGAGAVAVNAGYNYLREIDFLGIRAMKRFHAKQKARIMLSPADDNLYPPNPMSYLRLGFMEDDGGKTGYAADIGFKLIEAAGLNGAIGSMIPGAGDTSYPGALREKWNQWRNPKAYLISKRITVDQSQYFIKGKRIWDIFQEMSLKHPGWVFGTRPYGHKFQYTMFFGVPSQRYWAKPASNFFIQRVNKLRTYLLREQTKLPVIQETWSQLYGEQGYKEAKEKEEAMYSYQTVDYRKAMTRNGVPTSGSKEQDMAMHLELQLRSKIMQEYLLGLEHRFVPYRRYHMLTSEEDIVANNITASMHNVVNGVNVVYYDPEGSAPYSSIKMKAASNIPDSKINMANIDLGPNVRGYNVALRFGQGALIYGMKEMYRGELLVLGNHRIRPWDICILFDEYNSMCGPIEVEAVTHLFSHETGFLTEIVPNAVVIGNEISTYPVLEAMKIWMGATVSLRDGKKNVPQHGIPDDPPTYQDGGVERLDTPWYAGWDPGWNADLAERFDFVETGDFDLSDIMPELSKGGDIFRSNFGGIEALEDNLMGVVDTGLVVGGGFLGGTTGGGLGVGGSFGSMLAGNVIGNTRFNGSSLHKVTKAVGSWKGGLAAAGIGLVGGTITGALMGADLANSPTKKWLLMAPIMLNKIMENEAVIVVPLLKEQKPMVSGLSLKDPITQWKSVLGNIVNEIGEGVIGLNDHVTEALKHGDMFWQQYQAGFKDGKDTRNFLAKTYFKADSYMQFLFQ